MKKFCMYLRADLKKAVLFGKDDPLSGVDCRCNAVVGVCNDGFRDISICEHSASAL